MGTDATMRLEKQEAYAAGYDSVTRGPNTTNCHFRHFATPELTAEWERGRDAARLTDTEGGEDE